MPTPESGGVIIGTGAKQLRLLPVRARYFAAAGMSATVGWNTVRNAGDIEGSWVNTIDNVLRRTILEGSPDWAYSKDNEWVNMCGLWVQQAWHPIFGPLPPTGLHVDDVERLSSHISISWMLLEFQFPYPILPADIIRSELHLKICGRRSYYQDNHGYSYADFTDDPPRDVSIDVRNFFPQVIAVNDATQFFKASDAGLCPQIGFKTVRTSSQVALGRCEFRPHREVIPMYMMLPDRMGTSPLMSVTMAIGIDDLFTGNLRVDPARSKSVYVLPWDSMLYLDMDEMERGYNSLCMTTEAEELLLNWEFITDGNSEVKPGSLEIALFSTPCSAGAPGTELAGHNYSRVTMDNAAATVVGSYVPPHARYETPNDLFFPQASADWDPAQSLAIFDDTGRYLFFANFPASDYFEVKDLCTATIYAGDLWLTTHAKFLQALLTADALATVWTDFSDSPREFLMCMWNTLGHMNHKDGYPRPFTPTAVLNGCISNANEINIEVLEASQNRIIEIYPAAVTPAIGAGCARGLGGMNSTFDFITIVTQLGATVRFKAGAIEIRAEKG